MPKKLTIHLVVFILLLAMQACNSPSRLPTQVADSPSAEPLLEETATVAIPLPGELEEVPLTYLLSIDFLDRQNGWAASERDGIFLLRTQDGGLTWLDVTPPGLPESSYSPRLFILDVNNAWALFSSGDFYNGTLYRTSDGGASWTSNSVPFSGGDLQFLDETTGRILADRGAGAGSNAVELYQSSDGGLSWTSVFHNDPSQPGSSDSLPLGGIKNGMTFLDPDTGWVTGSRPMEGDIYLYATQDGGSSWAFQPVPIPADYLDCQFYTFQPIFFGQDGFLPVNIYDPSGPVNQVFYATHDGGATWTADPTDANQLITPAGEYSFPDALHGFAWNGGPGFFFTTDAARNWTGMTAGLDLSDSLSMIDFVDSSTGWALTGPGDGGESRLYQTVDLGVTWVQLLP